MRNVDLDECFVGVKPFERALLAIHESKDVTPPCKTKHPLLFNDSTTASSVCSHANEFLF